jgi:hypothetical protein
VRLRRVLAAAAAVTGIATAVVPTAMADSPNPWQPFHEEPFTDPAGLVCSFALHGDIVEDHELVRTLQSYPDGSPKEQEFVGPLVIRYTNLSNGVAVDRNLTGTGFFFFDPDGTIRGDGRGHIGLGVHIGNTTSPAGEWVLTGRFDFVLAADGTRTFNVQGGTQENLCETLARDGPG